MVWIPFLTGNTDKSFLLGFQFPCGILYIEVFSNKLNRYIFLEDHSGVRRSCIFVLQCNTCLPVAMEACKNQLMSWNLLDLLKHDQVNLWPTIYFPSFWLHRWNGHIPFKFAKTYFILMTWKKTINIVSVKWKIFILLLYIK